MWISCIYIYLLHRESPSNPGLCAITKHQAELLAMHFIHNSLYLSMLLPPLTRRSLSPTAFFFFQCVWYLMVLVYISQVINDAEHLFISIGHLYVFFGKISIKVFSPFLIRLISFGYWVVWVPYISWILTSCQRHDLQIFSLIPLVALSSHL